MTGIYIHVPYCLRRCTYCAFYSTTGMESSIPDYVRAVLQELVYIPRQVDVPQLSTIYFGGGTPSVLGPEAIGTILAGLRNAYSVDPDAEITLEANPGSLSSGVLQAYREAGVNRLSLGLQTVHQEELDLFGRIHTFAQACESYENARGAGFTNISLDLIFGAPGQTRDRFSQSLEEVNRLEPEHLSLYAFSLEEGTPFAQWVREGVLPAPDDDLAADMYEDACDLLHAAGYEHYEISNWAKKGYQSRHNNNYWRCGEYLGIGPSAHGYFQGIRYWNQPTLASYLGRMAAGTDEWNTPFPAMAGHETIDDRAAISEAMFLGLRLLQEGVSKRGFSERFGRSYQEIFPDEIRELIDRGLLLDEEGSLRLTPAAYLISNQVFYRFLLD